MDKKERHRQQWNERVHNIRYDLYTNRSVYDIAKEQSKLERQADKLLKGSKGATKNGRHGKNTTLLRRVEQ